ncbi:MAG TPA: hypothetical protein VF797_14085 [Noviherbaspirillum sp.]
MALPFATPPIRRLTQQGLPASIMTQAWLCASVNRSVKPFYTVKRGCGADVKGQAVGAPFADRLEAAHPGLDWAAAVTVPFCYRDACKGQRCL